jgi:hypothetical protein
VNRIRSRAGKRQQARIAVPDRSLTLNAGLAAVSDLCGRLGVIGALDAAVGPVKRRDRGFGAGELLTGIAAAQLAGEGFLTGLDRQRADAAGQQITPVPRLASTTAAGLAPGLPGRSGRRRFCLRGEPGSMPVFAGGACAGVLDGQRVGFSGEGGEGGRHLGQAGPDVGGHGAHGA